MGEREAQSQQTQQPGVKKARGGRNANAERHMMHKIYEKYEQKTY